MMHAFFPMRQRGVSLVEIMVGMVIGMLVMLVIYQVYTTFEGQKRTTTGGGDAQANGLFSISTLEREIRMAGWGLTDSPLMNCTRIDSYDASQSPPGPNSLFTSLMPVRITDGGTAAGSSDQITIRSSTSISAASPAVVTRVLSNASAELEVSSTTGINNNDIVVVVSGPNCTVGQVTHVQPAASKIQRNPGQSIYNPTGGYRSSEWEPEFEDAKIYNLNTLVQKTFSIDSAALNVVDSTSTGATLLASNVVSMKALYGISAGSGSQNVVRWVRAIPEASTGIDWGNPTTVNAQRIKAVRLAVVVRNPLAEKPDANGNCATTVTLPALWTSTSSATNPVPAVDLSNTPNWQCYRYRAFQTIIPLRNVIWANL